MSEHGSAPDPVAAGLYDVTASDPHERLIGHSAMSKEDVGQIGQLMSALARLREAERTLTEASLEYMKLNENDMRALRYLIAAKNRGVLATPGAIAAHLRISTASTTKLLDRLEQGGHITRQPHPTDRRALAIAITPTTYDAALNTVGRQQAKRFHAAARLTPAERDAVIRFLDDMATGLVAGVDDWPKE